MLVLSRKLGEAVVISGGIVVRVLDAGGGRIRLGVEAPDEVVILREEVADRLNLPAGRTESNSAFTSTGCS